MPALADSSAQIRLPSKVVLFFRMIKFEHSIFALPFAYLGLTLAEGGMPRVRIFAWVTLAMVTFRTAAMGLNRLIDQEIDARNPRTRQRELPAGKLRRSYVWIWTLTSMALFLGSAYLLNPLCLVLSPIPLILSVVYPFMKRFTWGSHFVLGAVLGMAPSAAWIASRGTLDGQPVIFSLGVLCWVAGFDVLYALQDMHFDRSSGLHSFPAKFGFPASLAATRFLYLIAVWMWVWGGWAAGLGGVYFFGVACVAAFLIYEHLLVETGGLKKLEAAFFTMNAWVSVALFAAAAVDLGLQKVIR